MFHSLCATANVRQLRVHDLRHSCATLLFTMGVTPATVQRILRHSSITVTTGTYVEVTRRSSVMPWIRWAHRSWASPRSSGSSQLSSNAPRVGHDERVVPSGATGRTIEPGHR